MAGEIPFMAQLSALVKELDDLTIASLSNRLALEDAQRADGEKKKLFSILSEIELLIQNQNLEFVTPEMLAPTLDDAIEKIKAQNLPQQDVLSRIQASAHQAFAVLEAPQERKEEKPS